MRQNSNAAVGKPGPLPANLDEMKVNVMSCEAAETLFAIVSGQYRTMLLPQSRAEVD